MPDKTFSEFVTAERARLNKTRDKLTEKRDVLDAEIATIDKELTAITAYETVREGKPQPAQRAPRNSSRRDDLVKLVSNSSEGLRRRDILERLGSKNDKRTETAVSNMLTKLVSSGALLRQDGRYHAPH